MRSADQVLAELLAISPQGEAMPVSADTVYAKMLRPYAAELAAVEALAGAFATEINPGTAQYLLPEYQSVLGTDPYGRDQQALSLIQQQQLAYSRWTGRTGVRVVDFIDLAASLGVAITIQEYRVLQADFFAGDQVVNSPVQFQWLITLPTSTPEYFEASSGEAGDLISFFIPSLAEPAIAGRAPAHTTPVFSYTG